mmetsp:Transcript_7557/g.27736  ORF Transcript_7557/g.27736 Transcript_7557/m.27736 type:complete len:221 (-) Transcript_7557:454-1116(-)
MPKTAAECSLSLEWRGTRRTPGLLGVAHADSPGPVAVTGESRIWSPRVVSSGLAGLRRRYRHGGPRAQRAEGRMPRNVAMGSAPRWTRGRRERRGCMGGDPRRRGRGHTTGPRRLVAALVLLDMDLISCRDSRKVVDFFGAFHAQEMDWPESDSMITWSDSIETTIKFLSAPVSFSIARAMERLAAAPEEAPRRGLQSTQTSRCHGRRIRNVACVRHVGA